MSGRTILLVEDDDDTRNLNRLILEMGGYTVLEAADGREALRVAAAARPALVLMDLNLPGMDGRETARRLREAPETASIPVVALSGHSTEEIRQEALEAGFAAYLVKAMDPDGLAEEVGRILERLGG